MEHEIQLELPSNTSTMGVVPLTLLVDVEWEDQDDSYDYEYGSINATRELHSTKASSFNIISIWDEAGEDIATGPRVNSMEKGHADTITSLLNEGDCTPCPPDHHDFKREAEEAEGERLAEQQWERKHYNE